MQPEDVAAVPMAASRVSEIGDLPPDLQGCCERQLTRGFDVGKQVDPVPGVRDGGTSGTGGEGAAMGSPVKVGWWAKRELAAGNTDAVRKLSCPDWRVNQPPLFSPSADV